MLPSLNVLLVQFAVGCLVSFLDFFDYIWKVIYEKLLKKKGRLNTKRPFYYFICYLTFMVYRELLRFSITATYAKLAFINSSMFSQLCLAAASL